MKKILFFCASLFLAHNTFCQIVSIDFESPNPLLIIDSTAGNIWQIGKSKKNFLSPLDTSDHVIITDTINFYPPNNYSSFIIKVPFDFSCNGNCGAELVFDYEMDADTLRDGGYVEFSTDEGLTWLNLNDGFSFWGTIFSDTLNGGIPGITGKRNWSQFVGRTCLDADSIMYRVVFKSDSIESDKEGWMIDNIEVNFLACEGIEEINTNYHFASVYPNPVSNTSLLQIKNENQKIESIQFFNSLGVLVKTVSHPHQNNFPILKKDFSSGMYLYRVQLVNGKMDDGKFVVE